ncbi:MAG TPA: phosphoribosyl-AMP cyclohydrolase [Candidatus Wunengus sp. YC60]|uniref:phosphoribosyl-AMP cyclohydrolase n=1 Tax=Candidatus Wunengus sp. YC60 TaxID=3367697 RepID=UPI0040295733
MKNTMIDFKKGNGLIPAIIQDNQSGDVLMLGYMNEEALERTRATGWVYFWSRSRKQLWLKGEESGNKLKIKNIFIDCDNDTLLIKAILMGKNVCHTGNRSCFYNQLDKENI